ncbi:MAG: glycosyltransferase family 2 protein [Oscillospiraceae bacterium]|nr:glycosyltransferase family 2 protein [Oscillospiraceae bacterium]
MSKIIVLIPCYNEEKSIDNVILNIKKCTAADRVDYLIINDCSKDNTSNLCVENGYNYLNLPINLGIGGGVQAGYLYALEQGYDIAIQHDGDGQHDPCYFEDVIAPIESEQADIVIGSRFLDKKGFQSTGLRRFGISFLSKLIFLCTGLKLYDVTSGYRAVNRKYIEIFATHYAQDYPEPESIVYAALKKAKIMEVPVIMHERKEGQSSINALKPLYYMIKISLSILLHRVVMTRKD